MNKNFRLSDEQLTDLATGAGAISERLRFVACEAVHELRERRLRDLSDDEIEALIAIRERVAISTVDKAAALSMERANETQLEFRKIAERRLLGIAVLDRIIGR
jgi:hypothetical protein